MSPFALKILISKIYDAWVFWKLSGGFQEKTLGGVIFVQEPEILLKKDSTTGTSYLGKFLKMDDL